MIELTEDPRQAIADGKLDHLLTAITEAVEARKAVMEPWQALDAIVEAARCILALRADGASVERRATLAGELQVQVKRWLAHPSYVVQDAAALLQESIFRDLLSVPAAKAKELVERDRRERSSDAGAGQAHAGQPSEG